MSHFSDQDLTRGTWGDVEEQRYLERNDGLATRVYELIPETMQATGSMSVEKRIALTRTAIYLEARVERRTDYLDNVRWLISSVTAGQIQEEIDYLSIGAQELRQLLSS